MAHAACGALAAWAGHADMQLRPLSQGLVAAALPLVTHPHCKASLHRLRQAFHNLLTRWPVW